MHSVAYAPDVFDVANMTDAMSIILTPEEGTTTQGRWLKETPYLADLISSRLDLTTDSVVLDYGCGIGRLSKALIEKVGCRVVGVDISCSMRALAAHYVNSPRFSVCHPDFLSVMPQCDAAISVWVLQHCFDVASDVANISGALKASAPFFVVNNHVRVVPIMTGSVRAWVNDGKDVTDILDRTFRRDDMGSLDASAVGETVADASYWAIYR